MQKHILIIDTETIGIDKPFIYDLGLVVAEKTDKGYQVVSTNSFVIKQIYDNKLLFETAYYHKKRPLYTKAMQGRKSIKRYWGHVARFIDKTVKAYGIKEVYAYNAPFDKRAIQETSQKLKTYQPLKSVKWYDIMAISNNLIHQTAEYKDYCETVKAITPKGYYQTNAERTYQFIKGDHEFKEEHMGLQDAVIELDILNECINRGYNEKKEYRKQFIRA